MNNYQKGFSLTELAISLVVMGLLIAGTLAGQELLKSARIKAAISEVETYKIAVDNFKAIYEALPGDLDNATSFWTSGTANGNHDGKIGDATDTDDTEVYYLWDQLVLARIISGSYNGTGTQAAIGLNVPASEHVSNAGFSLRYYEDLLAYTDSLGRGYDGHYIVLGGDGADVNQLSTAAITPEMAFSLDAKLDNSEPQTGSVFSGTGTSPTGSCLSGANYDFANTEIACITYFAID